MHFNGDTKTTAFAWTDRHSRPCPRIGLEVQFGSVPAGRTLAPLDQELHLLTEARPRTVYRRGGLVALCILRRWFCDVAACTSLAHAA